MDSYVYTRPRQRDEIRLIDFCPGTANQPLYRSLRPISLDWNGDFEALAYVWGSDTKACVLETADGRINITSSLHSALKRLRLQDKSHTLWADALRINQEDNEEKSLQVRLMDQVYNAKLPVSSHIRVKTQRTVS